MVRPERARRHSTAWAGLLVGLTLAVGAPPAQATRAPGPPLSGSPILAGLPHPQARPPAGAVGPLAPVQAGTVTWRWAYDFAARQYYRIPTTFEHGSSTCRIYVEVGYRLPGALLKDLAALFEDVLYARLRSRLGHEPEPGVDGDLGVDVVLLDVRDPYRAGIPPYTYYAGYFDPTNQYRQVDLDAQQQLRDRRSNEREMIYLDINPTEPRLDVLAQTLAHEFTHLIQWNYDPDEETWLAEGLSDLAVFLGGLGHPRAHVTEFLARPEVSLTRWSDEARDYGKVYLFLLYLFEQAQRTADGGARSAPVWPRALVADERNGLESLAATLPVDRDLETLFRNWSVAVHIDDPDLAEGQFGFRSLDIGRGGAGAAAFPAAHRHEHTQYPLEAEQFSLASWSSRADLFTFGRGDVDIVVAPDGQLCATLVAWGSHPVEVRFACGSSAQPLGWSFPDFRTGGRTERILAVTVNTTDRPITAELSALPPLGSLGWSVPVYLPIAVR